ncbi:MAG TPA: hypothetical protein VHL80_11555, partial [Polyangia bacterium]|nr:hypothetical protein [Polyangia bacterium]
EGGTAAGDDALGKGPTPLADDGGADAAMDAAGDLAPRPLPVASPASRLLVPGPAALVGAGPDSCTNAPGAAGDRWCAFTRPASALGFNELWVLDATATLGGAAFACDGSDARCLRLSTALFEDTTVGFARTGFSGDTLVYAETTEGGTSSGFVGAFLAWRPGWAAGRAISSQTGVACVGHATSDAALCFDSSLGDGTTTPLTVDLHAGRLSSASGPPLPRVDTLLLAAPSDAVGATPRFQYGFSPDGAYVAWSTRPVSAPDGEETLSLRKLEDGAPSVVVAGDVSQWAISPDGRAWAWLAGYNYDVAGAPSGVLRAAQFPGGAGATTLAPDVGQFAFAPAGGLWLRSGVRAQTGSLLWMPDLTAPAGATAVDTDVLAVLDESADGATFLYAKSFATLSPATTTAPGTTAPFDVVDLHAATAGGAPCALAETPSALGAALLPPGRQAVWSRFDPATGAEQGVATMLSSCTSTPFANGLRKMTVAGDLGLVYLDDADPAADEATLRYDPFMYGALQPAGTPIQTRAASVYAALAPALPAVVYTVATGTAADGLYVARLAPPATVDQGDASADGEAGSSADADAEAAP